MVELALARVATTIDLGYVFFGREELAVTESALGRLLEREAGLRAADLVVVMEPTANAIHAGCLGNVNATWTFHGRSGHSARPWLADNAIHRAAAGIHALAQVPPDAARVRRAALHRGRLGDAGRRRDRRQRRPRRGGRARQLPLRPRPQRRRGRGVAARRCASRTARWPSTATPPARPVAIANPMAQRLIAAGDLRGRAQAGVDARRRVRRRRRRRRQLRPRRPRPGPHPRRARARRRARALLRDDRGLRVRLNPVLAGMASYPFLRLTEAKRAAIARGVDVIDFGVGEPREETPAFIPRALRRRRSRPSRSRPTRPPRACPSCARRSRPGRSGASARRSTPTPRSSPRQGSKEAIFHLAQVVAGARRPRRRSPRPAIPWPARGALFAGARGRRAAARRRARLAARPRRRRLGRRRAAVAELPQQPDGGHRVARALRARRGAGARARLRPGLRRGLLGAVVRGRAARQRAAARRPHERRRLQHALQALLDARLSLGLRRRRSRDHRRAQALPPERRRRAADLHPARGRRPRGPTRSTSTEVRERYRAKRDALLPALLRGRPGALRRRRLVLPVAARARRRGRRGATRCACSSEHGIVVAPGPYFGPGGEGHVRIALVPTLERLPPRRRRVLASGA